MKTILFISLFLAGTTAGMAQKYPGGPDSTFNLTGFKFIDIAGKNDAAEACIVTPAGKIWLGGYSNNNSYDITFCRVNVNGTLDQTFKNNGTGTFDFSPNGTEAWRDLFLTSNGMVLGVGITEGPNDADVIVVRTDAEGTLDTNFGDKGHVIVDIFPGSDDDGISILEDKNGKIVIAGTSHAAGTDFFIVRLNSDGSIDSSFNTDGRIIVDELNFDNAAVRILERPQGGYYMIGNSEGNGKLYGTILSISNNGNLNIDLGGPGKLNFQNNAQNTMITAAVYFDESLIIAGNFLGANANSDGFVARLKVDGTLDMSFNTSGLATVITSLANDGIETINGLQLLSDSTLLLSGEYINAGVIKLLSAKFKMDGIKDPFFGNLNGMHIQTMPAGYANLTTMGSALSETDRRLYTYGSVNVNGNVDFFLFATYLGEAKGGNTGLNLSVHTLDIFPNPSTGTLTINMDLTGNEHLLLLDLQGRVVMNEAASNSITLNQDLENGVYFLKLISNNETYTAKVVVNR